MRLYHHTSGYHLPSIIKDGFIKPTESNVGAPGRAAVERANALKGTGIDQRSVHDALLKAMAENEHFAPDVVWLTDLRTRRQRWMDGSAVDKGEVCIVVEVADAMPWLEWAQQYGGVEDWWVNALTEGNPSDAAHWFVVPRPVERREWIDILERADAPHASAHDTRKQRWDAVLDIIDGCADLSGINKAFASLGEPHPDVARLLSNLISGCTPYLVNAQMCELIEAEMDAVADNHRPSWPVR